MAKKPPIKLTPEQVTRLEGLQDDIDWLDEEIRRANLLAWTFLKWKSVSRKPLR